MLPFTTLEKQIRADLKYNIKVNLWDGALFGVALGFASFGTVLPLFVASMTNSALLIGLVPAIHSVGWQLPQLFTASYVSRLRRYKRSVMMMTIHERVPFLGFGIIALLLPMIGLKVGLVITFLLLIWQGLGGGFTANSWTSMISKIIPPENRGTFFGFQAGLANLFISGSAVAAGYLLDYLDSPLDFAACFFIASIFFTLSWFALALTREPEDTEKIIPEEKTHFWDDSKKILKKDFNFNWFLVARFISQFATMGFSFYIIYALRRFNMDAITAGYLTATLTIAQTIANASMGWLGDKWGHRSMLIIGAAAALASATLAWLATSIFWFYPIFLLTGFANVSIWTIGMAMTVDFGTEAERPLYIGLSQTLTAPATILAPLLGGWIVDAAGFIPTFSISIILSIAMIGILVFLVKDPRMHHSRKMKEVK
ncbi:MAG TPA: MFS transporter [Anaerolineales bacterium]|nr:MFS transporter [Anaerolineales bacterium]HMX18908.1 MFS transporter [Anaerolineales bacterium]HMZ43041.1 MFS transporter [Anaerolineales bacterium]HNA54517.1 MFS transporter [Anaerolineales bacterium]HNB85375.1 MFS transporter [Anaerolineales bacterium]